MGYEDPKLNEEEDDNQEEEPDLTGDLLEENLDKREDGVSGTAGGPNYSWGGDDQYSDRRYDNDID